MAPENPHGTFHLFPRLPAEPRRKIWTLCIDDAKPQIYRFELRYPPRLSYSPWRNHPRKGDQVFLPPPKTYLGYEDKILLLKPLRVSNTTRHIVSATCVESRQVVLEMYPNTLRFRYFRWG
jgi:2EXR family